MKTQRSSQSGKQWLEFLAQELDLNAVQLKGAINRANRRVSKMSQMSTGTIKGQFTESRQPSREFQALVRATISQLIAEGKLGNWRDDLHSYGAFCARGQVIAAPMRFDRHHLRTVASYIGSYAVYRKTFEDRIGVDYITVLPPRSQGCYPVEWWVKEVVDGSEGHFLHHGFGYLSNRHLGIDVARAVSDRDARMVRMNVSRNEGDHTGKLVAVKLGCCAVDGAPRSRRVYLSKLVGKPLAEPEWKRVVRMLEDDITANGPGSMTFPEVDASNNAIRDIPERLLKLAADGLRPPANDSAAASPRRPGRSERRKA